MRIFPVDKNAIIIDTAVGSIHIYDRGASESGEVEIIFYDHFYLKIEGTHKNIPTITIDSNEFRTKLKVIETESKWIKAD